MGSFIGHAVPGGIFVVMGVWWMVRMFRRYFQSLAGAPAFRCQPTYPPGWFRRVDCEGAFVVTAAGLGMLIELALAEIVHHSDHIGVNNAQHATMYFFFGIAGFLSMFSAQLRPLLPNLDDVRYVSMALAFTAETLLFSFHLMGRDHLDITLHTLLIYSGYGCVIFSVLEMVYRHQLLLGVGRAFCTILMGTWFWQAGFVLYSPLKPTSSATPDNGWDHDDHSSIMMVTCVFCWHMAVIFVLSLCLALAFACWYKRQGLLPDVALVNNGYSHLMNHEEEIKNLTSNDTDEEETELTMETVGVDRAMVNNGTTVHAVS